MKETPPGVFQGFPGVFLPSRKDIPVRVLVGPCAVRCAIEDGSRVVVPVGEAYSPLRLIWGARNTKVQENGVWGGVGGEGRKEKGERSGHTKQSAA